MGLIKPVSKEVAWVYASSSISGTERVYTFDKTYDEISSLLDTDCSVILDFDGSFYIPTWYSTEDIIFLNVGDIAIDTLSIDTENSVTRNTMMFAVDLITIKPDSSITVSSYFKNIDDYISFNTLFLCTDKEGNFLRLNFSARYGSQYIFYYDNCNENYRYVFVINKSTLTCQMTTFKMDLTLLLQGGKQ